MTDIPKELRLGELLKSQAEMLNGLNKEFKNYSKDLLLKNKTTHMETKADE